MPPHQPFHRSFANLLTIPHQGLVDPPPAVSLLIGMVGTSDLFKKILLPPDPIGYWPLEPSVKTGSRNLEHLTHQTNRPNPPMARF